MTPDEFYKAHPSLMKEGLKIEQGSLCHCNGVSRFMFEEFLKSVATTQVDKAKIDEFFARKIELVEEYPGLVSVIEDLWKEMKRELLSPCAPEKGDAE